MGICDFEYFGILVNSKILKSDFNWNSTKNEQIIQVFVRRINNK